MWQMIAVKQRYLGRSSAMGALAFAVTLVMGGVVLTSCAFAQHHSDPTPTSSAPTTSTRHTTVSTPLPPTTPASGPAPSTPATALGEGFTKLESTLHAKMGIVISAVGANPKQLVFGDWTTGPAWSTSKVPLTIAALREEHPPTVTDWMRAAITKSDNAAAESIWEKLGDPVAAAHKVEAVLRQYGDPTTVEWRKLRPEFTAFGQTIWSLSNQARFTAAAVCDSGNAPIFALMGQVEDGQSWGLGVIPDTQFKGGWGPSTAGSYLVRQLGVLKTPAGLTAVAVATEPASGSFNDGANELTEVAKWLMTHGAELPAGQCDH
jgi:hypothetical protein